MGRAARAEERLGDVRADQRVPVERRHQFDGIEDADNGEPVTADVDDGREVERIDPQPLGGLGAEHGHRQAEVAVAEEAASGHTRPQHLDQVGCRRRYSETARLLDRDPVAAPDGLRDRRGAGCTLHRPDPFGHRGSLLRQLGRFAEDRLAGASLEQSGAEPIDAGEQLGAARRGDPGDGHDGGDPDGDAERREDRAETTRSPPHHTGPYASTARSRLRGSGELMARHR